MEMSCCILCSWLAQYNQGAVQGHLQMNLVFKIQPWARWQSEAAVVGERHGRWVVTLTRALFNQVMWKCTSRLSLLYVKGFLKGLVELVVMTDLHKQSSENRLWQCQNLPQSVDLSCVQPCKMTGQKILSNCSASRACYITPTAFNGKVKLGINFLLQLLRKIASNCPSAGSARVCAKLTQRAKVFGCSWGLILVWRMAISNKKHDKNAVRVQRPCLSIQDWELIKTFLHMQKVNIYQPPQKHCNNFITMII